MQNFSKIAKPLLDLMSAPKKSSSQRKWQWGDIEQTAFQYLKEALTTPPILGYPDYQMPFEVHVDASQAGLGAVFFIKPRENRKGLYFMPVEDSAGRGNTAVLLSWSFWH